MRPDLALLDVYANAVALAFHFVSNRSTFSAIFESGHDPAQVQRERRACIQDTLARQVMALARSAAPPRGGVNRADDGPARPTRPAARGGDGPARARPSPGRQRHAASPARA